MVYIYKSQQWFGSISSRNDNELKIHYFVALTTVIRSSLSPLCLPKFVPPSQFNSNIPIIRVALITLSSG